MFQGTVHNHTCMQKQWKAITAYEDSSTDEEGPEGSSIFWTLPLSHRSEYKPVLRAMRRAHNRRYYLSQLQRRGVLTMNVHPANLKHMQGTCVSLHIFAWCEVATVCFVDEQVVKGSCQL